MFTNITTGAMTYQAGDIHFSAWLCKWKIAWTEADLYILPIHLLYKIVQCLFKVGERNIFIDV